MGIPALTAENKIRKGKAIFFLNNVKKCLVFLYYSTFYIAAKKITDLQNTNKIPLEQLRIEVESVVTESDHISVSTEER